MTVVEAHTVLGGVRTRTLSVAGDGPPILLLHGFTDSADSWRPLLAELATRGRRAVAVDLPGSGRADVLPGGMRLEPLDAFTAAFVEAQGEPVVLAGNSLGGLLAMRAAARNDLPIDAIAPVGPAGLAYTARLRVYTRTVRQLKPLLWFVHRLPVPAAVVRRSAEWLYTHRLGDRSLAQYYGSHVDGMRGVRRNYDALLTLADDAAADPLVLDDVRVPVLLIWGRKDQLADVAGAQLLLDAVPDARLVVYDDCGHCPQVQRPADIATELVAIGVSA
jgi:pimeloyl-ACP methyl ester carboxylesterase